LTSMAAEPTAAGSKRCEPDATAHHPRWNWEGPFRPAEEAEVNGGKKELLFAAR